ncbi:MAG: triose-phosphate isomerase, partial [Gammaproteobacteria bacterium]|nr:triose-phosphate isomerase [Gammaproteobacteria bacterium]
MASGERTPLIAGNWKMHGSLAESHKLVAGIAAGVADAAGARVLLCPPYVYLTSVAQWIDGSDIVLGAQDLAEQIGTG